MKNRLKVIVTYPSGTYSTHTVGTIEDMVELLDFYFRDGFVQGYYDITLTDGDKVIKW